MERRRTATKLGLRSQQLILLLYRVFMAAPPLAGVKILELAGLAPVPFCGQILCDFGADVVRIDRPGGAGDAFGRGKRSMFLDLKKPAARSLLLRLIQGADVLLEPYHAVVICIPIISSLISMSYFISY